MLALRPRSLSTLAHIPLPANPGQVDLFAVLYTCAAARAPAKPPRKYYVSHVADDHCQDTESCVLFLWSCHDDEVSEINGGDRATAYVVGLVFNYSIIFNNSGSQLLAGTTCSLPHVGPRAFGTLVVIECYFLNNYFIEFNFICIFVIFGCL